MASLERVQSIFEQALTRPPDEREIFVKYRCGSDKAMAQQIISLLSAGDESEQFFDKLFQDAVPLLGDTREATHLGHYRLEEKLGEGGMGVVYKAWDNKLNRHVAIKVLQGFRAHNPEEKARFLQEAKAAAQLNHRYVCDVYETNESAQGDLYIVTAFCQGQDLAKRIATRELSIGSILTVLIKLCEAMHAAHSKGIYHRDLKPANIIVDDALDIKLVDFGIAKISGQDISRTGQIIGTLAYMAPEQFNAGNIDQRTDIWSLGVLLYYALTGKRPFAGDNPAAVMYQLFHGDIPQIQDGIFPGAAQVNHIFKRTINLDKYSRFQSCELLAGELRSLYGSLKNSQDLGARPVHDQHDNTANTLSRSDISEQRQVISMAIVLQVGEKQTALFDDLERCIRRYRGRILLRKGKGVFAYFGYPQLGEGAADHALACSFSLLRQNSETSTSAPMHVVLDSPSLIFENDTSAGRKRPIGDFASLFAETIPEKLSHVLTLSSAVNRKLRKPVSQSFFKPSADNSENGFYAMSAAPKTVTLSHQRYATPLLGRIHELGILNSAWHSVLEGEPRAALITGDAGMGKTRVIHELKQQLKTQKKRTQNAFVIVECQADPNQRDTPLYPVITALRDYLEIVKTQMRLQNTTQALEHWLAKLSLCSDDNREILAWLLGLKKQEAAQIAMRESPEAIHRKSLTVLERCITAISSQSPLILIAEDLHWADNVTLEWIDRLLTRSLFPMVFLVMTGRPEVFSRLRAYSVVTQLPLNRLNQRETRELIHSFYRERSLSTTLEDLILEKSSGNPLFAEEYTRMLLQPGSERQNNALDVPDNLAELVHIQLDRLGAAKIAAQTASIIGRVFELDVLAKLLNSQTDGVLLHMDTLIEAGTIYQRDPDTFVFKHALIRDALYNSIAEGHRHHLHGALAETLAADFPHGCDNAELIATHFSTANCPRDALHWWRIAFNATQTRYAVKETLRLCERALADLKKIKDRETKPGKVTSSEEHELAILMTKGPALIAASNYANREVGEIYERALALCEQRGDAETRFTAMMGLWSHLCVRAHHRLASERAATLVDLAEASDSDDMRVEAYLARGGSALFMADFDLAGRDLQHAIDCYRDQMSPSHIRRYGQDPAMAIFTFRALLAEATGDGEQARMFSSQAIDAGRRSKHPFSLGYALAFAVHIYLRQHDAAMATKLRNEYQQLCQEQEIHVFTLLGALQEGLLALSGGDINRGITLIEAAIPPYQAFGTGVFLATWWGILAMAYLQIANSKKSRENLERGLAQMERSEEYLSRPLLHLVKKQLDGQQ